MPIVPGVPSAEELSALPSAERAEDLAAHAGRLAARADELERRLGRDSTTSSRPPSPDSPYKKKNRDRSLRRRGKRPPGKQPGDPGTTTRLADDPDETFWYPPTACGGCGAGLEKEPVPAQRRHQVTDIEPAPAPKVTEHVARAGYGPQTHAQAANLTCGHHIPI